MIKTERDDCYRYGDAMSEVRCVDVSVLAIMADEMVVAQERHSNEKVYR